MNYLGLTVLTEDPNRRDPIAQDFNITKFRMDSGTGAFTEVTKGTASRMVRSFNWFMENRAAINAFKAFLAERQGALVPFWIPTWHHDLQLPGDVLVPATSLDVINVGYTQHQFDPVQTWRRHLAFIQIGAGIQFIRRIDGATENITTETLTLTSAPPSVLLKSQWMLSFLTLCRLESDNVKIHYHGKTVAECTFDVREIPNEMTPVPIP